MLGLKKLDQKILQMGYCIFVFVSVMSLSSWNLYFANFFNFNLTAIILALIALVIVSLMSDWSVGRLLAFLIFSLFLFMYFQLYRATYMIPILLALMLGTGFQINQILKLDFYSRLFSVLFVILLSLFSILPKSGYGSDISNFHFTIFCYGFTYANILAFEIAILFVEALLVIEWRLLYSVLLMIIIVVVEMQMGYETGAILVIVAYAVFYTTKRPSNFMTTVYLTGSAVLVPLFTLTSVYIAKMFSSTDTFWSTVNNLLSDRAEIWQYYYNAMPIKLLGNLQTINSKTMGVVGFGAFDGVYIQFLLTFGIVSVILLFALIGMSAFKKSSWESKRIMAVFLVPVVLSGFTETNGFLATFSPLYILLGAYLFSVKQGMPKKLSMNQER